MMESLPKIFRDLKRINPDEKVVYCKKCVVSNQRPRLMFNKDGVCAACLFSEFKKSGIDWESRKKQLEDLCDKFRREDGNWDVIVPGSGGKDSAYVAHMLKKEYGMHPLTVTWAPSVPTEIGRENLYNFIQSGYDNLMGTPNGEIHRKLTQITFKEFGDNFLPFIYGQLNFPFQIAVNFKIPLIVFGEDGDVEYGGSIERYDQPKLDTNYTIKSKFTSLKPDYWTSFGINPNDLKYYQLPDLNKIQNVGIEAHYFSYYDYWKPEKHYEIAKKFCGFKPDPSGRSEGTYTNYSSLDDKSDGFHYYLAFIKFGIGRATSDVAHQIRDGLITRDEGVELVKKHDDEYPSKYLQEFLEYMNIDKNQLDEIVDKFRRPIIWKKEDNIWKLRHQIQK